jgi:hypothetical protein
MLQFFVACGRRIGTHICACHRLFLSRCCNEANDRNNCVDDKLQNTVAGPLPHHDAHAAGGRSWERSEPLNVGRKPSVRQPEHRLPAVPEGQKPLHTPRKYQACRREVAVKRRTRTIQIFLCRRKQLASLVSVAVDGTVLFFSSSSRSLSCWRRSLAHFANWSWLLVALSSRRTDKYSFCFNRCSVNCLETGIGRAVTNCQICLLRQHISTSRFVAGMLAEDSLVR